MSPPHLSTCAANRSHTSKTMRIMFVKAGFASKLPVSNRSRYVAWMLRNVVKSSGGAPDDRFEPFLNYLYNF